MPAVKMSFLRSAVGICLGDEVKRSDIQRELGVESLHFFGIERSKRRWFGHLIGMHPDHLPLEGVLGTSVWTEGPWVGSGFTGGITNPVWPESASGFPRRLWRGGGGPEYPAATRLWIRRRV